MTSGQDLHPLMLQDSEEVGAFRIIRRLATGGFGAIFLAESETRRQVALKFALQGPSPEDSAPGADARTWKEAHVLMRLAHPNVVQLLGYRRWPDARDGYLVLIMGYVEGPTLSEWALHAQPTPRRAVQVFQRLALTLDAIHREGVLHRDIKGNNILIRASDGQPVLVDFGSGDHACSPVLTEDTLPPGTPSYRSPEALRFWMQPRPSGSRYAFAPTDDLYSLGLVLYEVLTGSFPYPAHLPPAGLLACIEAADFAPPSARNPRVPAALDGVVARLLSPHAADRHPTGAALFDALSDALGRADASWDAPLFPPRAPEDAVTEEAVELFDGDEEARELRRWMRVPEWPGYAEGRAFAASSSSTEPGPPWSAPAPVVCPRWPRRLWDWLKQRLASLASWWR
ncbi:serine/threonine protein kinase [Myxococcus hansupus]|uniref:Serine/threonine protein kinase n=1 Tax=Pseudomyxococcus hansupus TaxID=1297742 RepID=A0A0H4XPE2_9BACT|nr:serine/threonine-protein kinase [Myxococcus hansupus]AKQ70242.1 serine/threonine protein kinase [Myxococcus hansupus]